MDKNIQIVEKEIRDLKNRQKSTVNTAEWHDLKSEIDRLHKKITAIKEKMQ